MKKINKLISLTLLSSLATTSIFASDAICSDKMDISIEAGQNITQVITGVTDDCKYTVTYDSATTYNEFRNVELYNVNIFEKSIDEILSILVNKNNFFYEIDKDHKVINISKIKTKTFKIDFIDMERKSSSSAEVTISASQGEGGGDSTSDSGAKIDTKEEVDYWKDLKDEVTNILVRPEDENQKTPKIFVNKKAGMITVSATYNQMNRLEDYLKDLENVISKQVMIDVKIIAVELDKEHKSGVDWSKFSLGYTYSGNKGNIDYKNVNVSGDGINAIASGGASELVTYGPLDTISKASNIAFDMAGLINFLDSFGDSSTMSVPKVSTMNNQPTMISVGDNINYKIKSSSSTATAGGAVGGESETPASLFVGVLLDITPHIDADNLITLKVNPSISELKYAEDGVRQSVARTLPPDTTTRRISTVVQLNDGDTVVLGGLINQRNGVTKNKVNLLGDLPLLGDLFKSESQVTKKTELVFVIKANIIDLKSGKKMGLKEAGFKNAMKVYNSETEELIFSKPKTAEIVELVKETSKKSSKKVTNKVAPKTKSSSKEMNQNSPFYDFQ